MPRDRVWSDEPARRRRRYTVDDALWAAAGSLLVVVGLVGWAWVFRLALEASYGAAWELPR